MPDKAYLKTLERYEEIVALFPDWKRKGKANPYTSHNGHMFSFLTKEGKLVVRFSEKEKAELNEKHGTGPVIQHNSTMRGYVEIPEVILADIDQVKALFQQSFDYINSLPPKPSKKKT